MRMWCYYCTATVTFVSQVMSTWSPTFNLIEHSRIDDAPAVFPSVRTRKADRRCALIDTGYCRGHHSLLGRRAARSLSLPCGSGAGRRINRRLAPRLQSRRDGVVIGDRHLVPDLEFIEPLRTCGHVDRLELAIRRLDVHHALIKIDGLYGPRKGDGRISPLVRPGLMRRD